MKTKFFKSIQGKAIAGLTLLFLVLAMILFTSLNISIKQYTLDHESQLIKNYATSVAGKIDHNLAQAITAIEAIASTSSAQSFDPKILDVYLPSAQTINPYFVWFMVLDRNGTVIARPSKPSRIGENRSNKDYFQKPMYTKRSLVSDTQISKSGNISVHIATPIKSDSGVPLGVLSAPIGFADRNPFLYKAITNAALPDAWQVLLVDKQGLLIAHSHQTVDNENFASLNFSNHPTVDKVKHTGLRPILDSYTFKDEEWYSSSAKVELSDWTVIVQVPKHIINGHIDIVIRQNAIFITTFFILLLICATFAVRSFVKPLSDLTKALDRFGKKEKIDPLKVTGTGEISDAIVAFNLMINEREEVERELLAASKIESLGHLAAGIAHDFNNLLTGITGSLFLAKTQFQDPDSLNKTLDSCESAAIRAKGLAQQLLTFSKGGAPIKTASSIQDIVSDSANFILSGKDMSMDHRYDAELWPVDIDPGQISQVVQNLVLNAQEASPKSSTLTISIENVVISTNSMENLDPGKYVLVSVSDSGKGISKKEKIHIFDPYYSTKGSGRGLGLAACYSIITKHGGIITVDSTPGTGSVFNVFLPASEIQPKLTDVGSTDIGTMLKGKVLIMDDEKIIRETLKEILEERGFKVETANNGNEAINLYSTAMEDSSPFDLLLMDLTIPGGMGGKEAIVQLKKINPDVKAIVSSGYSNNPVISEYEEYGFCDILPKPFTGQDLIEILLKNL